MPTISGLSFSVKFDLTGAPALVVTDTTSSPPTGFVAVLSITLPDGYTYQGDISSPDISTGGGVFTTTLRLDSTGGVQAGTYTIKMTGNAPGYLSTDFTRVFTVSFPAAQQVVVDNFDVFTPNLFISDDTDYSVAGYAVLTTARSWNVTSTPTGVLTGTGSTISLQFGGYYWDAYYNVTLASTVSYVHTTYSWFTVDKTYTKSYTTYAMTPLTVEQIVTDIGKLDYTGECCDGCNSFQQAQTIFAHMVDKARLGDYISLFDDYMALLAVLHDNSLPAYVPTNAIIPAYNWGTFASGTLPSGGDPFNILMLDEFGVPVWTPAADIPGAGGGGSSSPTVFIGTI